jgi:hypothetical protein
MENWPILQPFAGECVTRARTRLSLGANFWWMFDNLGLTLCFRSSALNVRVRVCMGVSLYRGIDAHGLAALLGVHVGSIHREMASLISSKLIGRTRIGRVVHYHSTQAAQKLVRAELRRLRLEGENLVNELRRHPRVKQEKLDRLLGLFPSDEMGD